MTRSVLLVCTALAFFACEAPDAAHAPIIGGTRELGERAVVAVHRTTPGFDCTGTLISPSVVLTAKHCVQDPGAEAPLPADKMIVGVGDRLGSSLRSHRVRRVETTPGAYTDSGGAFLGVDVATLVLESPITDVEPILIRRDRPADRIGQSVTAIGFGVRPGGAPGDKYTATTAVTSIDGNVVYTNAVGCPGDSGGPLIQEEPERRAIGVASFSAIPDSYHCPEPDTLTGYNGLWEHVALIDRARALAGDCLDAGEERCNSADDDCDGAIDEGCAALGQRCASSADCAFADDPELALGIENPARCEDVGGERVCTRSCDPTRPASACASIAHVAGDGATAVDGAYCTATSGCEGRCVAGTAGARADGEPCAADVECSSLACRDPGDGVRRCLPPCRGGAGTCPEGEACAAAPGACGACVDPEILRAGRQLGEPCERDAECIEGSTCFDGAYCTHACEADGECAEGFRCDDGRCLRGARAAAGEPCAEQSACAAPSVCVQQNGRGWCTDFCEGAGAECPGELVCAAAGSTRVCAPTGSLLGEACTADSDCSVGDACEAGVCTRSCGPEAVCPIGFACRRDVEGRARCLAPPSSGGCAVAIGARGSASFVLVGLAIVGARRVRRRARRARRS